MLVFQVTWFWTLARLFRMTNPQNVVVVALALAMVLPEQKRKFTAFMHVHSM